MVCYLVRDLVVDGMVLRTILFFISTASKPIGGVRPDTPRILRTVLLDVFIDFPGCLLPWIGQSGLHQLV